MKRIWIYQADRLLTATEGQEIVTDLEAFAEQWKVHGKPLSASAELRDNLFIIHKADQGIGVVNRDGFEQLLADGTINDNTLVFDNTITHEHQMENAWAVPFHQSWHKRLFK